MESTSVVTSPVSHPAAATATAARGEFITFRVGAEDYGIDTLCVQEIRSYKAPTRIAHAPPCLRGVIDLRGVIVPILDMRMQLGCASADIEPSTIVIVLNVGDRVLGVVVDAVTEVMQIAAADIRRAPALKRDMGDMGDMRFIIGMAVIEQRLLTLLDIDQWLRSPELGLLASH